MSTRNQRDGSKERFWRRMVRLWRRSDLTIRAFCQLHDLAEPSFYAWRRTLDDREATAPAFVPVQLLDDDPPLLPSAPDDPARCDARSRSVDRQHRKDRVRR